MNVIVTLNKSTKWAGTTARRTMKVILIAASLAGLLFFGPEMPNVSASPPLVEQSGAVDSATISDRIGLNQLSCPQPNPGDILVIDANAGTASKGALFNVDPSAGGKRTIISDFGNQSQGPLGEEPIAMAVAPSGHVFVLDIGTQWIFRVNLSTCKREIDGLGGGTDIAIDASNNILVVDSNAGTGEPFEEGDVGNGALFKNGNFLTDNLGEEPSGIAVAPSGNILVTDKAFEFADFGRLFIINPSTGNITKQFNFNNIYPGCPIVDPAQLAIEGSGKILIIDPASGYPYGPLLYRFDQFKCTSIDLRKRVGGSWGAPGVAVDLSSGNILVINPEGGKDKKGALLTVDPTFKFIGTLSDFGDSNKGDLGVDPRDVAMAPISIPPPPPDKVDLTIADMEITQGIQNFANDVPRVQDKATYVRVYPKVDKADVGVSAQLRGFRGGVEIPGPPLRPIYPLAIAHTSASGGANRARLLDSFNFWVPPAWRSGKVTFRAVINADGAIPETDTTNNFHVIEREFTKKAPVCVVMIPVRTHGSLYTVYSPGFDSIIARFGSLWPVPDVWVYYQYEPVAELQARFLPPFYEYGPYELPGDGWKVITSLIVRAHFTDDPDKCDNNKARTHYVGMVSQDTETGDKNGKGNYVFAASWVRMVRDPVEPFATPEGGGTMAHELTHNYNGFSTDSGDGLHVNCGEPPDPDNSYLYAPNTIGPDDPKAYWGFDPLFKSIIAPTKANDYMSYCYPRWVSDYRWRIMFNKIKNPSLAQVQSLQTTNELTELTQSAEILVIGGAINPRANVASFEYTYRLPQGTISASKLEKIQSNQSLLDSAAAAYVLELVDPNGAVLFSQPFDSTKSDGHDATEIFFLTIPFDPNTARIRITGNGQEFGALTVSPHAPQVTVLQPTGGETITDRLTIRWKARDRDNDPLLYTIQYSPDLGASWQALVTQTPATTLTLDDTLSLPGSNQEALIRVIATDGINTGSDTSDPFTIQPHAPVAHIDIPSDQAIFALNSQIILVGGGRDAEDGPLGDEALTWLVNGQLLGGKEAALEGLAPGTYVIMLGATDSDNNTAITSVTITIVDTPVASADGYSTPQNTPLMVEAPGVLGNDIDVEGDLLSAVVVGDVSNGTLTFNADGSFTYIPNADFSGTDSFTYKVNDGTTDSNVVTVSLVVTGDNGHLLRATTATARQRIPH